MSLPGIVAPTKVGLPQQPISDTGHGVQSAQFTHWTPCPVELDTVSTDSKVIQKQNLNPPNPPFSKGGITAQELSRIRRRFNALLRTEQNRPSEGFRPKAPTYEELAKNACFLELIDASRAMPVLREIWNSEKREGPT